MLAYSGLGFAVHDKKTKQLKSILQDVSGRVERARVLAILGPSGAGKTTLLSLLTLRAPSGEATGVTTLGGRPLTPALFRKQCFYVAQSAEEAAWPTLTPREQLTYAKILFEAAGADREEGRVNAVLKQLGLESCADTVVGHELVRGGLSGGQKKISCCGRVDQAGRVHVPRRTYVWFRCCCSFKNRNRLPGSC